VHCAGESNPREVRRDAVYERNPEGHRDDNCELLHLNEACVLRNVEHRFHEQRIYTWTSNVLVAVNPYEQFDQYSSEFMASLGKMKLGELPPHCFSIAEAAYRRMFRLRLSQSIIVSGESGSGKTTNMNHVMRFLAQRSRTDSSIGAGLGQLLVHSNPVLEAFGNAQTVRNRNSSRFGKFVKVLFDDSGMRLSGMHLQTYLLEKVRVVSPGVGEQTFHIFYQMVAGASPEQREEWKIAAADEHSLFVNRAMLKKPAEFTESFEELRGSLTYLSIRDEQQMAIFRLMAGVLHLLDVEFVDLSHGTQRQSSETGCKPRDPMPMRQAARLLGCPSIPLRLVQRVIHTGRGEPISVPLGEIEARAARDSLCKAIYGATFDLLVSRFNDTALALGASHRKGQAIARRGYASETKVNKDAPPAGSAHFIGLLDMFGFEMFDLNGFEQLCINLANERLQQFFLGCVFKAEEEAHRTEGVPWPKDVQFNDNQGVIDLLTQRVLVILNEFSELKGASEAGFFERIGGICQRDPFFGSARKLKLRDSEGFVIRHFAGDVCYTSALVHSGKTPNSVPISEAELGVDTWLHKNKDRLLPELAAEIEASSFPLLAALFKGSARPLGMGRRTHGSSTKSTVAQRFSLDLERLLEDLSLSNAAFIRCVKPNSGAEARSFDSRLVLNQLRCLGTTDLVRLMHSSYPTRIPYSLLHGRYASGMPPMLANLQPREFWETIAHIYDVDKSDMYLGATKLFLRSGRGAFLEELSQMDIEQVMPMLMARIERMNMRRAAASKIAYQLRARVVRQRYLKQRGAASLLSTRWRSIQAKRQLAKLRQARAEKELAEAEARAKSETQEAKRRAEEAAIAAEKLATEAAAAREAQMAAAAAENAARKRAHQSLMPMVESNVERAARQAAAEAIQLEISFQQRHDEEPVAKRRTANALTRAQLQAVQELRLRLVDTVSPVDEKTLSRRGSTSDAVRYDMKLQKARRQSSAAVNSTTFPSLAEPQRMQISLVRDPLDGTLGIDLDQFAGVPTVAIVVPGGPAERQGAIRPGDVVEAINGISCATVADVIEVLSSAEVSAMSEVSMLLVRDPLFDVASNDLIVRELIEHESGVPALSGWVPCHCKLRSDRQLQIDKLNQIQGALQICVDLRASEGVQLVIMDDLEDSQSEFDLSCLQVRTASQVYEFRSDRRVNLARNRWLGAWRAPLEEMLMTSLQSLHQGWLFLLHTESGSCRRVLLDLSSRSELRFVNAQLCPERLALGYIDLAELQAIRLLSGVPEYASRIPELVGATHVLQLSSGSHAWLLTSTDNNALRRWASELRTEHKRALEALNQYTSMLLVDGHLDYRCEGDEWSRGYFKLTIGEGLQCFEQEPEVGSAAEMEALETIPMSQIACAVRANGIDYYDWCIDVQTTDSDYIRVRPPSQLEMTRWLATINLYCSSNAPSKGGAKRQPPRPEDANCLTSIRGQGSYRAKKSQPASQAVTAPQNVTVPPSSMVRGASCSSRSRPANQLDLPRMTDTIDLSMTPTLRSEKLPAPPREPPPALPKLSTNVVQSRACPPDLSSRSAQAFQGVGSLALELPSPNSRNGMPVRRGPLAAEMGRVPRSATTRDQRSISDPHEAESLPSPSESTRADSAYQDRRLRKSSPARGRPLRQRGFSFDRFRARSHAERTKESSTCGDCPCAGRMYSEPQPCHAPSPNRNNQPSPTGKQVFNPESQRPTLSRDASSTLIRRVVRRSLSFTTRRKEQSGSL